MYAEVIKNIENQLPKEEKDFLKGKKLHLGIFTDPFLTFMLEGKKTIESRFTKNKIIPYNKIEKEDIVFVKKSSGPILAYFKVKEVLFFNLKETPIEKIKEKYSEQLCVNETFWESKKESRYATLIFIDKLVKLKPFSIHKKGMQTWLILVK